MLYAWIRQAYSDRVYVDREFTRKTKALLREHTQSGDLEPPTVIYEIGPKELAALKESDASDTVKVLNLRKLITNLVDVEGASKPYLLSIGERASALAELYENRQISTQEALKRFEELVQEAVNAESRREALGLDENAFAIYTALTVVAPDITPQQAIAINAIFLAYPDYKWNTHQASELRTRLYAVLLPITGAGKMVALANTLMNLERV